MRSEKQIQIIACLLQSLKQAGKLADHDDGTDRRPPWMAAGILFPKRSKRKLEGPRDERKKRYEILKTFYSVGLNSSSLHTSWAVYLGPQTHGLSNQLTPQAQAHRPAARPKLNGTSQIDELCAHIPLALASRGTGGPG